MPEFQSPMTSDGEAKESIRVDRDLHTSRHGQHKPRARSNWFVS